MRKKALELGVEDSVKLQTLLDVADACIADCEEVLLGDAEDAGRTKRKELEEIVVALAEIREALEEVQGFLEVEE
jgi:hypothetical protein